MASSQFRRTFILLSMLLATFVAHQNHSSSAHAAESAPLVDSSGLHVLKAGLEAWRNGRLDKADRWLRAAWTDPLCREAASHHLNRLHDDPAFHLSASEHQVREALAQLPRGFRRLESRHFVVLSNGDDRWTREKMILLERTYHEFGRFTRRLDLHAIPPQHKLLCVLFADYDSYRSFAQQHDGLDAPWVAGYYSINHNRIVLYDDSTGPAFLRAMAALDRHDRLAGERRAAATRARQSRQGDMAELLDRSAGEIERDVRHRRTQLFEHAAGLSVSKTLHEAAHLLAFNTGVQLRSRNYPFWLSEGLAASFETDRPEQAFGPQRTDTGRIETFRRLRDDDLTIPLRELIELDEPRGEDERAIDAQYAQAHALFTWLYHNRRRDLAAYLRRAGAHGPPVEVFESSFGSVEDIERDMAAW